MMMHPRTYRLLTDSITGTSRKGFRPFDARSDACEDPPRGAAVARRRSEGAVCRSHFEEICSRKPHVKAKGVRISIGEVGGHRMRSGQPDIVRTVSLSYFLGTLRQERRSFARGSSGHRRWAPPSGSSGLRRTALFIKHP